MKAACSNTTMTAHRLYQIFHRRCGVRWLDSAFTRWSLRLFVVLGITLLPFPGLAQDNVERPEPSSAEVPVQEDEAGVAELTDEEQAFISEQRTKFGFLRLWNFANKGSSDGLAVFIAAGSSVPAPDQRLWLGRGSRPGELRDYAEFEPGSYELFVMPDASRQGNMVSLPESFEPETDNLLTKRLAVRVRAGNYMTVLVFDDNGSLAAKILDDSSMEPKKLRLFNFTSEFTPDVDAIVGDKRASIAQDLQSELAVELPAEASVVTFEVSYPTGVEGFIGRMNVEGDFRGVRSCSLTVAYDRYGRFSTRLVEDAPLN